MDVALELDGLWIQVLKGQSTASCTATSPLPGGMLRWALFRTAAGWCAQTAGLMEPSSDSAGILGSWLIPINPAGLLK